MSDRVATVVLLLSIIAVIAVPIPACEEPPPSTDQKVSEQQAQALGEAYKQVGMPAITHFEEMRMAKDIYELRDKAIATHTYIVSELQGCLVYLGPSVGYGLPYATQYSSPTRREQVSAHSGGWTWLQVPQAEPNGLFMPAGAEGTWVLMKNPEGDETKPVYIEPRVLVSPFRLQARECQPPQKGK